MLRFLKHYALIFSGKLISFLHEGISMGWQYASPYASHMLQEWSNMLRKGKQYASGGVYGPRDAQLGCKPGGCVVWMRSVRWPALSSASRVGSRRARWPDGQSAGGLAGWLAGWLAGSLTGWLAGWLG